MIFECNCKKYEIEIEKLSLIFAYKYDIVGVGYLKNVFLLYEEYTPKFKKKYMIVVKWKEHWQGVKLNLEAETNRKQ